MITGLPDYTSPVEQGIRCLCRAYYIVYLGGAAVPGDGAARARGRAEAMGAHFIDAREVPFMRCVECSQLLDFSTADACELVM